MASFNVSWTNEYPGIDHASGINQGWVDVSPNCPNNPNNVNLLRIDLTHPKIQFLVSPFGFLNAGGNRTTTFLAACFDNMVMQAMYATNANFFDFGTKPSKRDLFYGLAVSNGNILSYPSLLTAPCSLFINQHNAAIISTYGSELDKFNQDQGHVQPWTVVSGNCMLVSNGSNTAPLPSSPLSKVPVAARTAIGLSAPVPEGLPRYLYLLTIDGVDSSCSTPPYYGATLQDVAGWMIAAGAYNAIGLDGGGSTTMAKASSTGVGDTPVVSLINSPHDTEHAAAVCERQVALSLGVSVLW